MTNDLFCPLLNKQVTQPSYNHIWSPVLGAIAMNFITVRKLFNWNWEWEGIKRGNPQGPIIFDTQS